MMSANTTAGGEDDGGSQILALRQTLAKKDVEIAKKDAEIAMLKAENASLKAKLGITDTEVVDLTVEEPLPGEVSSSHSHDTKKEVTRRSRKRKRLKNG